MTPKDFFYENEERIKETARFIANRDNSISFCKELKKIKEAYLHQLGTRDREQVTIGDRSWSIKNLLEQSRHSPIEIFRVILFSDEKGNDILCVKGSQFMSGPINVDEIVEIAQNVWREKQRIHTDDSPNQLGLFFLHNHPFIYQAAPSQADLDVLTILVGKLLELPKKGIMINFVDYSIATDFDYWSFKQQADRL